MDYIIKKRFEDRKAFYLVKWKFKQHHQNSWVSEDQVVQKGGENLIADFEADVKFVWNKKKRVEKQRKKRTIRLSQMVINVPTKQQTRAHWIYGNRVEKVLAHFCQSREFKVRWDNNAETFENQQDIIQKESKTLCLFLEQQLKINQLHPEQP